jgi:hypothetical protein
MIKSGTVWKTTAQIPFNKPVTYKYYVNGTTWVPDPDPAIPQRGRRFWQQELGAQPMTCEWWSCEAPPATGTFDWRDAVMYFVFVDRFFNGDKGNDAPDRGRPGGGLPGGRLEGAPGEDRGGLLLDLGINALWLTVPIDNTQRQGPRQRRPLQYSAYHGYWPSTSTYEEHFGTLEDLAGAGRRRPQAGHQGAPRLRDEPRAQQRAGLPAAQGLVLAERERQGRQLRLRRGLLVGRLRRRALLVHATTCRTSTSTTPRRARFSIDNALWWIKETKVDGYRLDAIKHINDQWVKDLRARVKAEIEPVTGEHFYMVGETFTDDKQARDQEVRRPVMLDGQFDFPLRMQMASTSCCCARAP